jgi:hypothetical protein
MCDEIAMRGFIPECHEDRVNRDIKEFTERTGFNFLYFAPFMANHNYYVIEGFPRLIGDNGFLFDSALYAHNTPVWLINSKTQETRRIPKSVYDQHVMQWHREAEAERAEAEKSEWREKLKSMGVDVNW